MNIEELEELSTKLENELIRFKKLIEELKELKEEEQEHKRWRGKKNEEYYSILANGNVKANNEDCHRYDNKLYDIGNYFKTKEEAEKAAEKIKIYTKLKDLALRLNKGEKINWKNCNQKKYSIYLNVDSIECDAGYTAMEIGQIYCLDSNFLIIAKLEIGEENLEKLFEED